MSNKKEEKARSVSARVQSVLNYDWKSITEVVRLVNEQVNRQAQEPEINKEHVTLVIGMLASEPEPKIFCERVAHEGYFYVVKKKIPETEDTNESGTESGTEQAGSESDK